MAAILGAADGVLGAADGLVGQFIDGKDPKLAPPGQQTMNPMDVLNSLNEFQVKEKMSVIEALSAVVGPDGTEFEMPNKYTILNEQGKPVFFALETTDMCTRNLKNCCPAAQDCASWNVDLRVVNDSNEAEEAFKLTRPWSMTCCCFCRPELNIEDAQGNLLAKMKDPFACCDLTFKIMTPDGDDELYIKGGCCQWGLCCPLPCGPCAEVHFEAEDTSGEHVGGITKKVPSCLKFLAAPDVDNYEVDVGGIEDPAMKLAVMVVAIFMDFRYFNENANKGDEDGDGIPDRFDFSSGSD